MLQLLLVASLVGLGAVTGHEIKVNNMDEFLDFAKDANSGILFRNTTVFLETDLDFSGELSQQFEPIGINDTHYFPGTFDGQGHVISNLVMNSSLMSTGLFGQSFSITIRNLIIDSSCSITSSFVSDEYIYVGGFIGVCDAYRGSDNCIFENNVNLGSITFNGLAYDHVHIGGIAGYVHNDPSVSLIRNCANYGLITHDGISRALFMGGITGRSRLVEIQNCFNHGEIASNGNASGWRIGGIVGYSTGVIIDNCVNDGKMSCTNDDGYVGNIVGYILSQCFISHCYWNENTRFNIVGVKKYIDIFECATFNSDFVLNETVQPWKYTGKSLLDALNDNADFNRYNGYSRWLTNKDENAVSFTVNDKKTVTLNSQVILLPSIANGNKKWFDGWYTDKECTAVLETFTISGPTDLYAKFGENNKTHKIIFDTRGGSPIEAINGRYHEVISLPRDTKKDRYALSFWKTELGDRVEWDFVMPSYDITLYAVWAPILISNAEELVEFSKAVNYENVDYSGITVYLESDIAFTPELSDQFEPIGKKESFSSSISSFFNGTFDGQGHSIKGLVVNVSYSDYSGLFGYSDGLTIRNVVMDESCSVVPRDDVYSDVVYVGGIIGKCDGTNGPCIIENCINKMKIVYECSHSAKLYIGGIAGEIAPNKYVSSINNCINRGEIFVYDIFNAGNPIYVGGILGNGAYGSVRGDTKPTKLRNSDNYGNISVLGTTYGVYETFVDGIVGNDEYTYAEGCSNFGEIIKPQEKDDDGMSTGEIVGTVFIFVFLVIIAVVLIFVYRSLI